MDSPEIVDALGYIAELARPGCVNESANAIDDNEGAQLFFQGEAAMHPIGVWLVSWAIEEAPDLDFDYVNLPEMPGEGRPGLRDRGRHRLHGQRPVGAHRHRGGVPRPAPPPEYNSQMIEAGGHRWPPVPSTARTSIRGSSR